MSLNPTNQEEVLLLIKQICTKTGWGFSCFLIESRGQDVVGIVMGEPEVVRGAEEFQLSETIWIPPSEH